MALTILIKFCGFIEHSILNNMTLSAFPGKIPETIRIVLIFCPSGKITPKPTDQSCSNSISGVPLQISLPVLSVFELPQKLRIVHIRKKFKISIFSKMAPTILFKYCGYIVYLKPNNMALSAFPEKIPETGKNIAYFKFFPVS